MPTENDKLIAREQLASFIERYNQTLRRENADDVSEETVRSWLNELLAIFGWNVQDTSQVLQERTLRGVHRERLDTIHAHHRRPDYTLVNGPNIKTFLDAKALSVDIFTSADAAYQIRCYGWSARVPCAFVSNLEQLVIYDTRFIPAENQPANAGTKQFTIDSYLENFDSIFDHLWHDNICDNNLERLYETRAAEGRNQVDKLFTDILSDFRLTLATNLLVNNNALVTNDAVLNYYTQVILDRIVFIRVCESKGIEEIETLLNFAHAEGGFWHNFKQSCYMEFYSHYDGAMFDRDDRFQRLCLDDDVLMQFINKLYYPYPYRFDVIPVKVIAGIYEEFLGEQLCIRNGLVTKETKDEYVRTNGAVCTPEHIVDMVCKQTLQLENINTIEELLNIKLLDPCCGSGVFAIASYDILANKMMEILAQNEEQQALHTSYFCIVEDQLFLTVEGRRALVTNCIHGIDCDESAVEVTKMSLALKIVDGSNPLAWNNIGVFGERILRDIAQNIKLGNTLVSGITGVTPDEALAIKPIDLVSAFQDVFALHGGFSYVIGNPPYVETKHYKAALPIMHRFLSNSYVSFEGKADLAVLFIERCMELLSGTGKLGFIIQRRWFKTEYGKAARRMIADGQHLEKLIDFQANDIFRGRMTYVSIVVLSRCPVELVKYMCISESSEEIKSIFENNRDINNIGGHQYAQLPHTSSDTPWNYENHAVIAIRNRLAMAIGTLADVDGLSVKDGIQALWKKMYHLTNVRFADGIAQGLNGFRETVRVEADCLRGIVYNKVFYPFKELQPDAYCIFPYEGASTTVIPYHELQHRFPLLYDYLSTNEARIKEKVECRADELWHTFTREHNHALYNVDKIIIPMTARDTIATYVCDRGMYMDNSNVWFISMPTANQQMMKAIACIINSTVFSVLGKAGANPQSGGYYKFNKQFLLPIPFPVEQLHADNEMVQQLANLYDHIIELQRAYISSTPEQKAILQPMLRARWIELDEVCYRSYSIQPEERTLIANIGRTEDRISLINEV